MKIQYQDNGITVFESALYRTTSTVIELNNAVIIIDPNWLPFEIDFIVDFVYEHYPSHDQYLLFTHSDYDHIIGYGAFPDATVIASQYFAKNPKKEEISKQILDFDHEYYIKRNYPISYPKVDIEIINDGQTVNIGGMNLVFYHALGHVSDGLFIVIPDKKCWIAGDYLSNIEIPFIDHDYWEYLKTIQKASQLLTNHQALDLLIVGHGDVATNRTEIEHRIQLDAMYLNGLGNRSDFDFNDFIKQYSDNPNMGKAHEKNLNIVNGRN
ncbi:MAG TPA: MBL fold metallo-hydrolase [Saprospiraceae bacterium]|nr:MBL fold metallo-hydrolase [Saprospiraceae bacterium]